MRIALTRPAIAAVMMLSFGAARTAPSREVTRCDNHPPPPPRQTTLFPIAFYSNSTEFAAGGIGLAIGVGPAATAPRWRGVRQQLQRQ
jgi:hypothetical protein